MGGFNSVNRSDARANALILETVTRVLPPILTRCRPSGSASRANSLVRFTDSSRHAVGTSTKSGSKIGSVWFIGFIFQAVAAGRTSCLTDQAAPLLQI